MKSKRNPVQPVRQTKLSRTHAPPELSPADWQRALRRQFGREQAFVREIRGEEPIFSDFRAELHFRAGSECRAALLKAAAPEDN